METAVAAAPSTNPPPLQAVYADSIDSSPRSRQTDSWESPPASVVAPLPSAKLRLMCSYGGHIVPRPHDKSLCYVGGTTRIVVADRHATLASLSAKLSSSLLGSRPFSLKYQLPNEDLDSLISVSTDEDLENMIEEYDRIAAASSSAAARPSRLRLFLFPHTKPGSTASSISSLLDDSKCDNWFVDALNGSGGISRGLSADSSDVNCLLGLEDDAPIATNTAGVDSKPPPRLPDSPSSEKPGKLSAGQEIHSVPDSPMMETTSSFGSTSSASCLSNLPPIRVHVDDGGLRSQDVRSGLEEPFSQMNVGGGLMAPAEKPNRVFLDDERAEQAMNSKPQQSALQPQQKLNVDELGVNAFTRDIINPSGAISHQKLGHYQESVVTIPAPEKASPTAPVGSASGLKREISDSSYRIPVQVQESGYVLPLQHHDHQQFIHAAPHYIHPHLTGPVSIQSYYQLHPQQHPQIHQQQLQQNPMFFMQQNQAYCLPIQPNLVDQSGNPVPTASAPTQKPELAPNLFRASVPAANQPPQAGAPQFIHVSDPQHQFVGYHQLHHLPQSAAAVGSAANFSYEYMDPSHAQIYYTQHKVAAMAPQYQTVTSGAMISDMPLHSQMSSDAKQNRTS